MPDTRPLIVGADGGLGRALATALRAMGHAPRRTTRQPVPDPAATDALCLDLADGTDAFVPPPHTDVVFLCAAVTATEQCRRDPAATRRVNVEGTVRLARRLVAAGSFVLFPSTNLVFDGQTPHTPATAPTCPRLEYGRQKAEAEAALLGLGPSVAVVRLTKVIGPDFPLFVRFARELAQGRAIAPFADMVMAPVALDLTVRVLLDLARERRGGLWQLSAGEDISYARAALALCRRLGADEHLVRPVSWRTACPDMEHVPAHTTLDGSRLTRELGLARPPATAALDRYLPGPDAAGATFATSIPHAKEAS